jgi:ABC-type sugar transport system substrate-binding protein
MNTTAPKNTMKQSIRLILLALAAAAGVSAFQSTGHAVGSTQLITICFRGNTVQVPFYLRFRYFTAGGYAGPCLTSNP